MVPLNRSHTTYKLFTTVTMDLSCSILEIKRDIGRKSRFFIPLSILAPSGGVAVGIHIILPYLGVEKLEWCGYPMVKEV